MKKHTRETAAVLTALRKRDEDTFAHSTRTCALSIETGRALGLACEDLAVLRWAAELHDIGKIGIPDRVLLKPDPLDAEELALMRTHSRLGYQILAAIPEFPIAPIADVVLHHHEAFDGSGYPDGLRGEANPFLARILAVVDAYDAIASSRPYHAPRKHGQVMRMLHDQQVQKYDPYVLARFSRSVARSPYRAAA